MIEWGDGIWGAEAAARAYFKTTAAGLSAEQAALLAAVIINPRRYNPLRPDELPRPAPAADSAAHGGRRAAGAALHRSRRRPAVAPGGDPEKLKPALPPADNPRDALRGTGSAASGRLTFRMINYTAHVHRLMADIVSRVPALSQIDVAGVLVFARLGRASTHGAYATCHSLMVPDTEPGYYFWRDRRTGHLTRRSEWFVTRSPQVRIGGAAPVAPHLDLAAAVLRPDAEGHAERGPLPERPRLDGQARHDRPRALPRRSARRRDPDERQGRRAAVVAHPHAAVLPRRRAHGARVPRQQARPGRLRVPRAELRGAAAAPRRHHGHDVPRVSGLPAALPRASGRAAPRAPRRADRAGVRTVPPPVLHRGRSRRAPVPAARRAARRAGRRPGTARAACSPRTPSLPPWPAAAFSG